MIYFLVNITNVSYINTIHSFLFDADILFSDNVLIILHFTKTLLIFLENNKMTQSFSFIWKKRNCSVMVACGTVCVTNHHVFHFFFIFPSWSVHTEKSTTLFNIWTQNESTACEVEHSCLWKEKKLPKKV